MEGNWEGCKETKPPEFLTLGLPLCTKGLGVFMKMKSYAKEERHWHRLHSVYPWHNTGTSSLWEGIMNVVWGQPRPQPVVNTHHSHTNLFTGVIIFYSLSFNHLTSISWIFIWRRRRGRPRRGGWVASLTQWTWVWANSKNERQGSLACCSPWGRRVRYDWVTEQHSFEGTASN